MIEIIAVCAAMAAVSINNVNAQTQVPLVAVAPVSTAPAGGTSVVQQMHQAGPSAMSHSSSHRISPISQPVMSLVTATST